MARWLVIIIPLFTFGYLWESQVQKRMTETRGRFVRHLQEHVEQMAVAADPELFLQRPMTAALRRFQRNQRVSLSQLSRSLNSVTHGCQFDLFLLHDAGSRLEASDQAENLWLMRRLLLSLRDASMTREKSREINRLLSNAFGLGIGLERFQRGRGRLIAVPFQGGESYLAWEQTRDAALLIFCRHLPQPEQRFRAALAQVKLSISDWVGMLQPGAEWLISAKTDRAELEQAYRAFLQTKRSEQEWKSRGFWFVQTRSGETLVVSRPLPSAEGASQTWAVRLAVVLLIPMLGWAGSLFQRRARVRGVVGGLFLVTALVPLLELAQATMMSFEVRRSLLKTQVERGEQEVLRRLEEGVDAYLERLARRIEAGFAESQVWRDVRVVCQRLRPLLQAPYHGVLEVRDRNGRVIEKSEQAGIQELFCSLQRMVFELWVPTRLSTEYEKVDSFLLEFMRHPRTGFRMLSQRPRQFQLITSGTNNTYMYWDYAPETASGASFLSLLFASRSLIEDFLSIAVLERTGLWQTQYRLVAMNTENQRAFAADDQLRVCLIPLFERARVLQRPLAGTIRWRGERWVVTSLASTALQGFGLAALFPERAIEEQLRHLKYRIGLIGLVTLLLAGALAFLVSRRFLQPVDELSRGVEAIQRKDFSSPVPVHGRDELGRLAQVFNLLAEELKDLDVARAVQTRMIPREYPVIEEY
ncbi:MAG TPA: HAMP domain-containing protein, partial [Candidatus Ozemobacteraceae bacterium]|nr:HAMP domain-containing protein [Candidatus Ozemobacteraceae bacterium]